MNVFVRGTVEAGANVLHAKIKADMAAGAGEFVTEWRFAEIDKKENLLNAEIINFPNEKNFNDSVSLELNRHNHWSIKDK